MIGGVTRLGGLPGLPGRVTRLAGVAFCHVNDSGWGNPPSRGRVHVTFASAPKRVKLPLTASGGGFVSSKVTVKRHSIEMLHREQKIKIK